MFRLNLARALFSALAVITLLAGVAVAQSGASKHENYIEAVGKILTVDPIKGHVTVRMQFIPHGNLKAEDGSLAKNVKFDTVSSNGKQEITFEKGKRISPTELVLNMYDGFVEDYPFDNHKANIVFFFTIKPDKQKPNEAADGEDQPKAAEEPVEGTEVEPAGIGGSGKPGRSLETA
jgi:hypothetical protein